PPLLCLSVMLAPYGWAHDQVLCMVAQGTLVALAYHDRVPRALRTQLLVIVVVNQLIGFAGFRYWLDNRSFVIWQPIVLFLAWYMYHRELRLVIGEEQYR